jgi:hypothetical protein
MTALSSQAAMSTERETKCTGQRIPFQAKRLTALLPNAAMAVTASAKAIGEHARTMVACRAGFRARDCLGKKQNRKAFAKSERFNNENWHIVLSASMTISEQFLSSMN